ncbi:hypothetical protein AB205_0133430, partial [Aquarana catesbeiana]
MSSIFSFICNCFCNKIPFLYELVVLSFSGTVKVCKLWLFV